MGNKQNIQISSSSPFSTKKDLEGFFFSLLLILLGIFLSSFIMTSYLKPFKTTTLPASVTLVSAATQAQETSPNDSSAENQSLQGSEEANQISPLDTTSEASEDDAPAYEDSAQKTNGKSYILFEASSQSILIGENIHTPLSPGNITNIMTVLLALENLSLKDEILITRAMYDSIPSGYVSFGFVEGEKITVEDAIYAALLTSANDASLALALTIQKNLEDFAMMMNQKAADLGCLHTNFTNPYGLEDPNHLTTAYDMALILNQALQLETFQKISTISNYTIAATNKNSKPRTITNGNRYVSSANFSLINYIGGKSGYSPLSNYTIAAGSQKDKRTLIGVILGAENSNQRYQDLIELFDFGYQNFSVLNLETEIFQPLTLHVDQQIKKKIKDVDYPFILEKTQLDVKSQVSVLSGAMDLPYTLKSDLGAITIYSHESPQKLTVPVFLEYEDGSTYVVGNYIVELIDPNVDKESFWPPKPETVAFWIKTSFILLGLLAIIIATMVFFNHHHKKKQKHESRKKPKIL